MVGFPSPLIYDIGLQNCCMDSEVHRKLIKKKEKKKRRGVGRI